MAWDSSIKAIASKLGLWFNPITRIVRSGLIGFAIALPLALMVGCAAWFVGQRVFHSTWSTNAVLTIQDLPKPPNLAADVAPYDAPQASDAEVVSWVYDYKLYRDTYPLSGRNDGVAVLRSLIHIGHQRDARRIHISYRGAGTAEDAVATTRAFAQRAIQYAQLKAGEIIDEETKYYQRRVQQAEQEAADARKQLVASSQLTGIVDVNEEAVAQTAWLREMSQRYAQASAELSYLEQRLTELPELMEQTSQEVIGSWTKEKSQQILLNQLREKLRRYEAVYAEGNPLLINARDELRAAEKDMVTGTATAQVNPTMIRNPLLDVLASEQAQLLLDKPALQAEVKRLQTELLQAEAAFAELPGMLAQHRIILNRYEDKRRVITRLNARLGELKLIRGLQQGQLAIAQQASLDLVDEKSRDYKAAVVAGAATAGTLLVIICLIMAWLLIDRRIRSRSDLAYACDCNHVYQLPSRQATQLDSEEFADFFSKLADSCSQRGASYLVLAQDDVDMTGRIGHLLARAFADSRQECFLLADGASTGIPDPGRGMVEVITGQAHPSDVLVPLNDRLGWMPFGDQDQLKRQIPSANIEVLIAELMERANIMVVAAPSHDRALLRRLGMAVEGVIAIADPQAKNGSRFARLVRRLDLPVVAALRMPPRDEKDAA